MKMFLISDNVDTRTGLRLAGVDGVIVHEKEELGREINKALDDKELAVLLINGRLAAAYPLLIDEIKLNRGLPLVVEIPDRHGVGRKADFISEYIRKAIGVKL